MPSTAESSRPIVTIPSEIDYRLHVALGAVQDVSGVHIFGRNPGVDTTERFLWAPGAVDYGGFLAAASALRIKAGGNAADAAAGAGARKVLVTGLNANFVEVSEEVTLAGASASSPTTTTFIRVLEAHVTDCGAYATPYNTGDISIETTGGVEVIRMLAGRAQSQVGIYTVPAGKTLYVARMSITIEGNKAATVRLYQREDADVVSAPVTARRLVQEWPSLDQYAEIVHETWEPYAAKTDLWFTAFTASGTTAVSAELEGYLVDT